LCYHLYLHSFPTRRSSDLSMMNLLHRIDVDPAIRFGKPCVRGTRISVGDVLGYLAGGMSETQILVDFPQLTPDDVRACLAYAARSEEHTSELQSPYDLVCR